MLWTPTSGKCHHWCVSTFRTNANDEQLFKLINFEYIKMGIGVYIGDFCLLNAGKEIIIGDETAIHAHVSIIGGGRCQIGKRCSIGYYTLIVNGTDTYRKPTLDMLSMSSTIPEEKRNIKRGTIIIEDDVYIGPHCTITIPQVGPDKITIGHGSIIGAYSYIDKDIPPEMIVHPVQRLSMKPRPIGKRPAFTSILP